MPTKAELDAHLVKKKGVYQAVFRDREGKVHERTTKATTIEEARAVLEQSRLLDLEATARAGRLTAEALTAIMAGRKVTCEDALAEWVEWRKTNAAPNTLRTQELALRKFFNQLGAMKWALNRITFEHLDGYVNAKDDTGVSNRAIRLASLRTFFDLVTAKAYYVGNPSKLVKIRYNSLSHEQKEPEKRVPFTAHEFNHIIKHTEGFWKAAVLLSYWTGLRLTDVACLEWASLLPDEIIVHTRKTHSRVALPIDNLLLGGGVLRHLFFELMETNHHPQYVFPKERDISLDPTKRARHSVYFSRILTELGIEGKSFHCLRHSFATRLAKSGKSIEEIGRALGHSKRGEEVTKGYVHK